jgi:hypothetical protein
MSFIMSYVIGFGDPPVHNGCKVRTAHDGQQSADAQGHGDVRYSSVIWRYYRSWVLWHRGSVVCYVRSTHTT